MGANAPIFLSSAAATAGETASAASTAAAGIALYTHTRDKAAYKMVHAFCQLQIGISTERITLAMALFAIAEENAKHGDATDQKPNTTTSS